MWYWEVGILPESLRTAYQFVDEVWCASDHIRAALEPYSDRPVLKPPLVLLPTVPTRELDSYRTDTLKAVA